MTENWLDILGEIMTGNILGILGTWLFADGLYSLLVYTHGEKAKEQSWLRDHSFRICRAVIGIAVVIIGGLGR